MRATWIIAAVLALPALAQGNPVLLSGVPNYDWWYGCSPTAAGMLLGYYDRDGYDGKYYGNLVPGGKAELCSYGGGGGQDLNGDTEPDLLCNKAIASAEHIDDYWGKPDPMASGRTSTAEWNCLADFMGTSQGDKNNGITMWHDESSTRHYWDDCTWDYGLHGVVKYIQYAGYDVDIAYRQAVTTESSGGFTYNDYKAEIDAGRPMLVHITGHTMCGVGYDDEEETIYVYDTWNEVTGVMIWGDSYSNLRHKAITALTISGGLPVLDMTGQADWWGAEDGRSVSLAYQLAYPQWADCAVPAVQTPEPGSSSMPCYSGAEALNGGDLVHTDQYGGAWGVLGAGQYGQILFTIDNCENPDEMKFVIMQVQVRTEGDGSWQALLAPSGDELVTGGQMELIGGEDGWEIFQIEWEIMPQPPGETITLNLLTGAAGAVWIQNVSINTHCTPEPATLCMFCGAAAALLRRKRRGAA